MRSSTLKKIKIYKKNSLYADFLFSYPSSYVLKKLEKTIDINIIGNNHNLLYVHIPFCFEVCTFCNVNKTKLNKYDQIREYLEVLFNEIDYYVDKLGENNIFDGIYIGGGTPTTLNVKDLEKLFKKIFSNFNFKESYSFEIDAHPTTITQQKLELFNQYKVQQISMGIQSMETDVMDAINRKGQSYIILEKLSELFKKYNFKLHFDFIIGLPNESIINIEKDVCYIAEKFTPYSISINGYDNTVDTKLFTLNKNNFRSKDYKNNVRTNVKNISKLLKNKYGITRKLTYYFDNFFNNLSNVIGLGSGSYGYINKIGVYKNLDYEEYIKDYRNKKVCVLSEKDEKIMYIIHNYDNENLNKNYYNIFQSNIYNDFKETLDIFIEKKYVKYINNNIVFIFKNNAIAQFELIELYSDNILKLYE